MIKPDVKVLHDSDAKYNLIDANFPINLHISRHFQVSLTNSCDHQDDRRYDKLTYVAKVAHQCSQVTLALKAHICKSEQFIAYVFFGFLIETRHCDSITLIIFAFKRVKHSQRYNPTE